MEENPLDTYSPFEDADIHEVKPAGQSQDTPNTLGAEPISPINDKNDDDDEIKAYEARLNALENHLNNQATQLSIAQETGNFEEPPNFPKFYPLIHFDIEEVPENLRNFVNTALLGWCFMFGAFLLNWLGCLFLLGAGDSIESPGSKISLSTLYLFVVVPIAIDFDALEIYQALRESNPSNLKFMKIFIFLGVTIFFEGILTLGLESSGSCGLITMISLFTSGHWLLGLFSILVTLCLGFTTYFHYVLASSLWQYYRGTEQGENLQDNMKHTIANVIVDALQKK